MPNIIKNVIKFYKESDKESVVNVVGNTFDFNQLIPMPKSLEIESGSREDVAILYYLTDYGNESLNIKALPKNILLDEDYQRELRRNFPNEKEEDLYLLGKQYISNFQKYNATTWHSWRRKNWGTKWNAMECSIQKDKISFETAWNTPMEIWKHLAKQFPDISCTIYFASEDPGSNHQGIIQIENGIMSLQSLTSNIYYSVWGNLI